MGGEYTIELKEDVPKQLEVLADDKLTQKTEDFATSRGIDYSFAGLKKKKKRPVQAKADVLNEDKTNLQQALDGEDIVGQGMLPSGNHCEGSDRVYEYEELLSRVFNVLLEINPELTGDRRRTVLRPPEAFRDGSKKTVFANFMDYPRTMRRQPEHVMTFILAELGTTGSLDGQQRLVVKGRFPLKSFEGILRRYMNDYVICNACRGSDTILSKENRLSFIRCEQCLSERSVAPIKTGFVARVGHRKTGA